MAKQCFDGTYADSEAFGLLGRDHPLSLYKAYVKVGRVWVRYEFAITTEAAGFCPIAYQAGLAVASRAASVWAPMRALAAFSYDQSKPGLVTLFERVHLLAGSQDPGF